MGNNPYNLIGNPLEQSVIDQVKRRASLQGVDELQSEASIIFKSRKNAFAKLTSFVKVKDDELAKVLGDGGIELAKKWTLFNGIYAGNGKDYSILGNKSYGQGGITELGVRPMPGIKSINITPAGTAGSVRIAKIELNCHNLNQLDIIDVLYLRLGFDMLLEWGHTTYADNNGGIQIAKFPIDIFSNDYNKEELYIEMNKRRRESFGNYDAMLGRVSNYSWAMDKGGSYTCTLTLTGIGAIIESLKVNGTDGTPIVTGVPTVPSQQSGEETKKSEQSNTTDAQTTANNFSSALSSALMLWKQQALLGKNFSDFNSYVGYACNAGLGLWRNPTEDFKYGYNSAYMAGRTDVTIPQVSFEKLGTYYYPDFEVVANNEVTTTELVYIPLGLLLAYMNSNCTMYNTGKGVKKPLVYIDFNPDTNFCFTFPAQCSVDPTVCLLDFRANSERIKEMYTKRSIDVAKITPELFGPDMNVIATDMDSKKSQMGSYIDDTVQDFTRGKIMNILVSIDYILLTLQNMSMSDKDGIVYLSGFLDNLLSGIAKATGNINKFKVGYDDDSNVMRIYDEQLVNRGENTEYPTFPIYGLGTVVHSLNFSTDVSNKLASAIATTAAAGERNPVQPGQDVSAFTALNSKLENRIMPFKTVTPSGKGVVTATPENLLPLAISLNQHMINIYSTKKFNILDIQNVSNFYSETCGTLKSNIKSTNTGFTVESDSVTARGILPLKIDFTMDGISTMKLREGFVIPADRLPSQYKNGSVVKVGFVISKLDHEISNNRWVTKVTAQMVNIPKQNTLNSGYTISQKARQLAGSAAGSRALGSAPITTATPPTSVSKLGFIWPLNIPYTFADFLGRAGSKTKGVAGNPNGHKGYDITGPNGSNKNITLSSKVGSKGTNGDIIYAIADSTVKIACGPCDPQGYGGYVVLSHNIEGKVYESVYGHLPPGGIQVKAGQKIKQGTPIGYMGTEGRSSGFHLHFELYEGEWKTGKVCDPGDFLPMFVSDGGAVPGNEAKVGTRYGSK